MLSMFQLMMNVLEYVEEVSTGRNHLREVISHSMLKHADRYKPDVTDTNVNWTVVRGGKVEQLLELFRTRLCSATSNTTYILHVWHNSVRQISINYVWSLIDEYTKLVNEVNSFQNMTHKIVWAEADYPPENEEFFRRIDRLNIALREANRGNGFNPCKPHRITTPEKNGRRRVTESRWEEAHRGTGRGYHVREKYLPAYFKFFRNYFKFNDVQ